MIYIIVLSLLFLPLISDCMDTPAPQPLIPYDIPYEPGSEIFPGGTITIEHAFGTFNQNEEASPYRLLDIPYQHHPSMILREWESMYQEVISLDTTNYKKTAFLLAASKLNLPIPPQARDTRITPNYDAFMKKLREIYLKARPKTILVTATNPQNSDDGWCSLL